MINPIHIIILFSLLIIIILLYILAFHVKWREILAVLLIPLAKRMPSYITPNHITLISFLFILAAGIFIYLAKDNHFFLLGAAISMLLFAVIDSLDGLLARIRNQITKSGSFLDYTLDKIGYLLLLFAAMLGGHIKTEMIVITMLLSLFYNIINMESQALSGSKSPLTEHSRWLIPAISLCLIGFFSISYKLEALALWGIKFQILDVFFLTLPTSVLAITLYKIVFLWKKLGGIDQEQGTP